jgi:hypothetical protein
VDFPGYLKWTQLTPTKFDHIDGLFFSYRKYKRKKKKRNDALTDRHLVRS